MQDPVLLASTVAVSPQIVQQQAAFITSNGDQLLPSIAVKAIHSYVNYY
jgi:hypothetical protein